MRVWELCFLCIFFVYLGSEHPCIEDQRVVDHVMSMGPHDIAEAFHDPMMMALGGMVVMAGAYMAIVMQEQAAASAFALAAAGGKKKK